MNDKVLELIKKLVEQETWDWQDAVFVAVWANDIVDEFANGIGVPSKDLIGSWESEWDDCDTYAFWELGGDV